MDRTQIIAFAGKGGVGKTSLAALTVRLLGERYPGAKILAIDADPAVGLSTALGVEAIHTVDSIRKKFIDTVEEGDKRSAIDILGEAHYDIVDSIVETERFAFLAIGRPEAAGCYCKVNSFLKDIIEELSASFDFVVIDGEAGIEQINRRVMEKVNRLVLVTDASRKGINVVRTIREVADDLVMYDRADVLINRIKQEQIDALVLPDDMEVAGFIPDDEALALIDIKGESMMELEGDSLSVKTLKEALNKMDLI